MGSRLILIGCGKTKAAEACAAADLYTGSLFRKRRGYAEATGCEWRIVSAARGLLLPGSWVEPYDVTMDELSEVDRAAWGLAVVLALLSEQADDMRPRHLRVEIHAGAPYAELLKDVLHAIGAREVLCPLAGLGIGEQLAWYGQRSRRTAVAL